MSVPKLNSTRTSRITKNKTLYEGGNAKKLQLNLPAAKRSTKNVAAIKAMVVCPQINWLVKNIQQKILKDDIVTKLEKSKDMEKLYPSCQPDRNTETMPIHWYTSFHH